jgi:hypothetical protein
MGRIDWIVISCHPVYFSKRAARTRADTVAVILSCFEVQRSTSEPDSRRLLRVLRRGLRRAAQIPVADR